MCIALGRWTIVVPDHVTGARVDRPDVVGHGEVEHAVHQQRRRLDLRRLVGLKCPGQGEIAYILRRDLREANMPAARVVAMINEATNPQLG